MLPPAPGLFSTSTVRFRSSAMCWAMLRATVSVVPPGGAPTTSLMVSFWAWAGPNGAASAASSAPPATMRGNPFMACLLICCIDDNTSIPEDRPGQGGPPHRRQAGGAVEMEGSGRIAAGAVGLLHGQPEQQQHAGQQARPRQAPAHGLAQPGHGPQRRGQAGQRRDHQARQECAPAVAATGSGHCRRDAGLAGGTRGLHAFSFEFQIYHCHKPLLAYLPARRDSPGAEFRPGAAAWPGCAARSAATPVGCLANCCYLNGYSYPAQ